MSKLIKWRLFTWLIRYLIVEIRKLVWLWDRQLFSQSDNDRCVVDRIPSEKRPIVLVKQVAFLPYQVVCSVLLETFSFFSLFEMRLWRWIIQPHFLPFSSLPLCSWATLTRIYLLLPFDSAVADIMSDRLKAQIFRYWLSSDLFRNWKSAA